MGLSRSPLPFAFLGSFCTHPLPRVPNRPSTLPYTPPTKCHTWTIRIHYAQPGTRLLVDWTSVFLGTCWVQRQLSKSRPPSVQGHVDAYQRALIFLLPQWQKIWRLPPFYFCSDNNVKLGVLSPTLKIWHQHSLVPGSRCSLLPSLTDGFGSGSCILCPNQLFWCSDVSTSTTYFWFWDLTSVICWFADHIFSHLCHVANHPNHSVTFSKSLKQLLYLAVDLFTDSSFNIVAYHQQRKADIFDGMNWFGITPLILSSSSALCVSAAPCRGVVVYSVLLTFAVLGCAACPRVSAWQVLWADMNWLSISLVTGGLAGGLDTSREDDKLCQSFSLPKSFSQKLQEVIGQ